MKRYLKLSLAIAGSCLALAANSAEPGGSLTGPWLAPQSGFRASGFLLAQNSTGGTAGERRREVEDELPWYSKNKMHKYLGLGSMALATATLLAPKEEDGAHEQLANGAAALAVAAVANGVYAHWDDMEFTWEDPDTRHALLGALGTLGYVFAVAKGGEGGHAAAGGLGAVAMAYAIKITW